MNRMHSHSLLLGEQSADYEQYQRHALCWNQSLSDTAPRTPATRLCYDGKLF